MRPVRTAKLGPLVGVQLRRETRTTPLPVGALPGRVATTTDDVSDRMVSVTVVVEPTSCTVSPALKSLPITVTKPPAAPLGGSTASGVGGPLQLEIAPSRD